MLLCTMHLSLFMVIKLKTISEATTKLIETKNLALKKLPLLVRKQARCLLSRRKLSMSSTCYCDTYMIIASNKAKTFGEKSEKIERSLANFTRCVMYKYVVKIWENATVKRHPITLMKESIIKSPIILWIPCITKVTKKNPLYSAAQYIQNLQ